MSLQTQHDPKNEAEITYWNSAGGRRWVERQQSQDIVLGPILQATLERLVAVFAGIWIATTTRSQETPRHVA
jgi:hypothetical protein